MICSAHGSKNNLIEDFDFSATLLPPANDRSYRGVCCRKDCIDRMRFKYSTGKTAAIRIALTVLY